MKAMILAAGLGTRLGDISKTTPKCLVEAGGKTLLEHVIDNLKRAGVTDLVINLHHLGDKVIEAIEKNNKYGLKVVFSPETTLLGTGGGIRNARELLEDSEHFFVHNGDIFSDIDLKVLYETHVRSKALATLAVMDRTTTRHLLFDSKENLVGWSNVDGTHSENAPLDAVKLAFSGIQIVSKSIFKYMENEVPPFSTITTYLNGVKKGETVKSFRVDNSFWIDVGTPEKLKNLQDKLKK